MSKLVVLAPPVVNAFNNHTTTAATATVPAHLVIASLASELRASGEVLNSLHHFAPMASLLHAMADLQERGIIDKELKRKAERAAVLSMAKQYLAQRQDRGAYGQRAATSQDLVRRLRTVAGHSTIKPPALDLEAADHIEHLQRQVEASKQIECNLNERVK
ncbi:hypothetical protein [Pseudoduganella sp. R-43]|uniref:hypothetical protein n=1 Tax=Pseudoduganella sp. R-43 TaxID=3404063 RepID=UPI003CEDFC41